MFTKDFKKTDEEICAGTQTLSEEEVFDVNIKAEDISSVISPFSYDENDKLSRDLSEFIMDKTKRAIIKKEFNLNFYSSAEVDKEVLEKTVKNHFKEEYLTVKEELKRNNAFFITMMTLGMIFLTALILSYALIENVYLQTVLEIADWVFIWEAVDSLFLQRPLLRAKLLQIQKIYKAKINVIKK